MKYKLTDNIEVGLNKITPRTLKLIRETGVWDYNKPTNEIFIELQKIYLDDEVKFKNFLNAIFKDVPDDIELDEVNLDEVSNAVFDFFGKLAGHLGTLSVLSMLSASSDLKTN